MNRKELPPEFAHLEPLTRALPEVEVKNWVELIDNVFKRTEEVLANPSLPSELRKQIADFVVDLHYLHVNVQVETRGFPASRFQLSHHIFERVMELKRKYSV